MRKEEVVVDTNVPLVANGKAEQADLECEVACVRKLIQIGNYIWCLTRLTEGHTVVRRQCEAVLTRAFSTQNCCLCRMF